MVSILFQSLSGNYSKPRYTQRTLLESGHGCSHPLACWVSNPDSLMKAYMLLGSFHVFRGNVFHSLNILKPLKLRVFENRNVRVCVCVRGSARIEQGHPGTASHLRQILQSPQPAQLSFLAAACAVVVPASWVASELALMFQSSAFIKYNIYIYR